MRPRAKRMNCPPNERFWPKVAIAGPSACWEWAASLDHHGYGHFKSGVNSWMQAHRYAWILTNGPIPDGMFVCHRCDNRGCCNPAHLFIGTPQDNTSDMMAKRRHRTVARPGIESGRTKLTDADVLSIRRQRAEGVTLRALSVEFGLCSSAISHIGTGRNWKHLSP